VKSLDVGEVVSIVANVGIIAGIVFLGLEPQQNNQLLEAESRYVLGERAVGLGMAVAQNRDLAQALAKLDNSDPLDAAE
jgi:hypothetical protein